MSERNFNLTVDSLEKGFLGDSVIRRNSGSRNYSEEDSEASDELTTMTAGDGTGVYTSTLGLFLHMLFVALPKDIWRLLNMKKKSVKGQTVVITGGASGLGQKMAEILSLQEGANVAIIDVDEVSRSS